MSIPVAIVEDEPWVRRLLISEIAWKRLGLFLVVEAEDGPQALRLCRPASPGSFSPTFASPDSTAWS